MEISPKSNLIRLPSYIMLEGTEHNVAAVSSFNQDLATKLASGIFSRILKYWRKNQQGSDARK